MSVPVNNAQPQPQPQPEPSTSTESMLHTMLRAIPEGWSRVLSGPARYGDKWWSVKLGAWLPVTGDDWLGEDVAGDYVATVIRRGSGS